MSTYIQEEAILSEGEQSAASETSEPKPKRQKKLKHKKRLHQISSDEEDEDADDEAKALEEMRDFVVDDEDEEGGDEGGDDARDDESSKEGGSDDDLLEDELELINENTGQNHGGRVYFSDEEDDRDRIKEQLFGGTDNGEEALNQPTQYQREYDENGSRSESEQSEDPFIVHDDERHSHRKGKKHGYNDQVYDEAKDIFGVEDLEEFYEDEEIIDEELEEGEEGVRFAKPRGTKITLLDTIEPSELEKGFVRAEDKKIICEDRPERFQIRKIPVTEIDDHDLTLEALWIYEYAFKARTLSQQSDTGLSILKLGRGTQESHVAEVEASDKIHEAIRFIRNQLFEVPFIAFYRKEYVESSLLMPDLWKVYQFDEKWCRLQMRKAKILDLLKRVQKYITESGLDDANNLRKISENDYKDVVGVQTNEELSDVYAHFQLYYGNEINRIQEWERHLMKEQSDVEINSRFKLSGRTDKYQLCLQYGLAPMADSFGLTSEEFAENYTEYVKHEVRQIQKEPNDEAKGYVNEEGAFPTPEKVIEGATYILAQRFSREPAVRKKLRQIYRQNLLISILPTKKGKNEIDESHWLWGRHYIRDKPVSEIMDEEYLQYVKAKKDELIEIDLHIDGDEENNCLMISLTRDPVFNRDEYFYVAEEWNRLRKKVLSDFVNKILIPIFKREAHEKLLDEARNCVIKEASISLHNIIAVGPFKAEFNYDIEDDDIVDTGTRIMAICYSSDKADASFVVVVDENGVVLDHQRMVHFIKRINSRFPDEVQLKKNDMKILLHLMQRRQPHLIVLNGEDLDALRLANDIRLMIENEITMGNLQMQIPVEITDSDASKVYMNSRLAMQEFVEFPPLLRQAVSLARFALDPLIEICHLCNVEDDILFMKFHPMQNEVSKQDLLFALQIECINRVNEVGVDINRCLEFPHTAGLLQFVCGLGPRKASYLLKILKQNDNLLESRTKLVTFCRMGPKVFMNSAGFIKIDTAKVAERTDSYVEVLDGSRVHPETYEWARKMAVDALELDDTVDQTVALEEILKAPDRLKELDLDAFAEELTRQGFGNKSITLYDIRAELNYRYKDQREPHKQPDGDKLAQILLKENWSNIEGKLILGQIITVAYRRPQDKEANLKERWNDKTSTWACPFCKRDNFKEPSDIAVHTGQLPGRADCPGIPFGFRVRLDNGLNGFVHIRETSDNPAKIVNPTKLFKPGQNQYFRIIKFKPDRFECELSCKSSQLKGDEFKNFDKYFDKIRFDDDKNAEENARKNQREKKNIHNRVTSHPCFHNVTFKEAEKMLKKMDRGETIIRPSAKSTNHLTVTWKVADDTFQHIQVEERDKQRSFEIGKKLFINDEEFEDLDEIVARYVQPMSTYVRDIMSYKYYVDGVESEKTQVIENLLREQKKNAPQRVPYCITASKKYPGQFVISYLALSNVRHENMSITPNGIRFRKQKFSSTQDCVNWFKMNFAQRPA